MTPATLSTKAPNRATLARQFLLERARTTVLAALEHLAGMQAQAPARLAPADDWTGRPCIGEPDPATLMLRYLGAAARPGGTSGHDLRQAPEARRQRRLP